MDIFIAHKQPTRSIDIYTDLSPIDRIRINSVTPFVPAYVKDHVASSSNATQLYTSRVQGRQILLENPARSSKAKQQRDTRKARRLAAKANREAGVRDVRRQQLWKLKKEETKFNLFLPLHSLWLGYMSELLALAPPSSSNTAPSAATMHAKLVKADFHGAIISVKQSKNPCLVGLQGIVIHETENAFKIITRKDALKLVPKQNAVFMFAVPLHSTQHDDAGPLPSSSSDRAVTSSPSPNSVLTVLDMPHIEFDLYGNQFRFRAAERAGRKFKHKETIEL